VTLHHYRPDIWSSIGVTAAALSDVSDGSEYAQHLPEAVLGGYTTLEQARTLLANSLRVRFRLGEFDPPGGQAWLRYGADDVHTPADEAAAMDASRQGLVLLKNGGGNGTAAAPLPLDPTASVPLAVIGPHANDTLTLQV
jgi:beta-glucosidase-like glycosyl hydrolase